ncbi:RNaseH domain-containing protein [Desulfosporosinus nitroreducens]|uniref:RNAseH domain-containing protein n=1 Tax=Desulfosporosinus nitroreducens TaxID=2018668 RepID=A0ABT8QXJ4_9FIRM|nr:RNaseH domain-containing protein [Desulfosporosinus nitroreducens]MDO0825299.1 RNAseH domain-containing protein [Desulfosporosinus nitroreducens]
MLTAKCNPGKLVLKQQAVEFFPTGVSSEEEADGLAKVTQLLRNANLTFGFSTAQPFPLHLLKSFQKYWAADLLSVKQDDDGWVNEFQGEGFDSGMDERIRLEIWGEADMGS